jgi:tetratricopeptide (TPR) repeat protein
MHSNRFPLRYALAAVFLGCSTIWAGLAPAQSPDDGVEQLRRDATAAQQAQHYDQAAVLYRKILTLQPDLVEAEVNLGLMYQLTGDLRAAISCFERVLVKSPSLYPPNLLAGLDSLKLGHPEKALHYLKSAVALKPQSAEALAGLANTYLQLHRYAEAEAEFKHASELNDGKNADAWYGLGATYLSIEKQAEAKLDHASPFRDVLLGESYLEQGQTQRGLAVLKTAAEAPSTVPCIHSLIGFAYLRSAQNEEAAQQFALDWNESQRSGCLLAKLGQASVDAERSDGDAALRELQQAAAIDPVFVRKNTDFFYNSMVKSGLEVSIRPIVEQSVADDSSGASLHTAESDWAHGHYSACISKLGANLGALSPPQLRLLSRCSYYLGEDERVLDSSAQLLKSISADSEALYWRAQSAQRLGLEALAKATTLNPESASLHALSGDMLRGKGDLPSAAEEYRKAIALKPDFLAAHLGLARDLYSDSKPAEAEQELKFVLSANPDEPEANYLMGEILLNRKSYADALLLLQKALRGGTDQLPFVHLDLSKVYEEQGNPQQAIAELKQALPVDEDGSYYYRLGRLYLTVGDRAAAAEALKVSAAMHQQADSAMLFQKQ